MTITPILLVFVSFLISNPPATAPADNPELKELYEQDQAVRADSESFFKNGEQNHAFDQMRRMRVLRLIDDGVVRSANDHFYAAMVLQHGDSPLDYKLAHDLCKRAAEIDPSNKGARWLMAASWDRYLGSLGKPQWYGTQFKIVDGKYYLAEADLSRVTDAERKSVGTRTVEEISEFLKKQNKSDQATLDPPPAEKNVWTPNMPVPKPKPATQP